MYFKRGDGRGCPRLYCNVMSLHSPAPMESKSPLLASATPITRCSPLPSNAVSWSLGMFLWKVEHEDGCMGLPGCPVTLAMETRLSRVPGDQGLRCRRLQTFAYDIGYRRVQQCSSAAMQLPHSQGRLKR